MRGYFKIDNELHDRPCVRAAKRDPMTRQVVSVWIASLSLAKECGSRGRLEHDGGPHTIDDIADRAGVVVPAECVTRDASVTVRDVTLRCVTLCVTWGWLIDDGGVYEVASWGAWYGDDEEKLERKRAQSRARSKKHRDKLAAERHAYVTRDVTRDERDVTPPEPDPEPEPDPSSSKKREKRSGGLPDAPQWLDPDAWAGFVEHRRKVRKPLTERACKLLLGKLDRWRDAGHDANALLDEATEKGWLNPVDPTDRLRPGASPSRVTVTHTEPVAPRPPIVVAQPKADCAPPPADLWSWDTSGGDA